MTLDEDELNALAHAYYCVFNQFKLYNLTLSHIINIKKHRVKADTYGTDFRVRSIGTRAQTIF